MGFLSKPLMGAVSTAQDLLAPIINTGSSDRRNDPNLWFTNKGKLTRTQLERQGISDDNIARQERQIKQIDSNTTHGQFRGAVLAEEVRLTKETGEASLDFKSYVDSVGENIRAQDANITKLRSDSSGINRHRKDVEDHVERRQKFLNKAVLDVATLLDSDITGEDENGDNYGALAAQYLLQYVKGDNQKQEQGLNIVKEILGLIRDKNKELSQILGAQMEDQSTTTNLGLTLKIRKMNTEVMRGDNANSAALNHDPADLQDRDKRQRLF